MTTLLHSSLLKLAYPEHTNNPKNLTKQNIDEAERALKTILEEDEVNEMVYPILDDIIEALKRAKRIRYGEDPDQENLFNQSQPKT